jgi:hypothetical protein
MTFPIFYTYFLECLISGIKLFIEGVGIIHFVDWHAEVSDEHVKDIGYSFYQRRILHSK